MNILLSLVSIISLQFITLHNFSGLSETLKSEKRTEEELRELREWIKLKHQGKQKAYISNRAEKIAGERKPFTSKQTAVVSEEYLLACL